MQNTCERCNKKRDTHCVNVSDRNKQNKLVLVQEGVNLCIQCRAELRVEGAYVVRCENN